MPTKKTVTAPVSKKPIAKKEVEAVQAGDDLPF